MIYNLTYRPRFQPPYDNLMDNDPFNSNLTCKWVVPSGMAQDAVIADFERRFFGTRVVSLEPAEVTT